MQSRPFHGHQAAIAFILVTAMLDILSMGIVIPVLPALIEEFTGSNAQAGVINGVFVALWAGMQFLVSPVIGSLSDHYGRRPVILISAAGLAIDGALMALAPNLWWLAVGRMLGGLTSSSRCVASANRWSSWVMPSRASCIGTVRSITGRTPVMLNRFAVTHEPEYRSAFSPLAASPPLAPALPPGELPAALPAALPLPLAMPVTVPARLPAPLALPATEPAAARV